ncbi:MAG: hypothetical protein HYZ28_09220 [Myxococcales bacterium]|nr:hypothetical protein [Myxococcales bacterium]
MRPLFVGLTLLAAPLLARGEPPPRQSLVGAQAGVAQPSVDGAQLGPAVGVSSELSIVRQLAFRLSLEQSVHRVEQTLGPRQLGRSSLAAALLYRFDVDAAVPYAGLSLGAILLSPDDGTASVSLAGSLALGLLVPLGERWFGGAEASYGIALATGGFPDSRAFLIRIGWRSGEF